MRNSAKQFDQNGSNGHRHAADQNAEADRLKFILKRAVTSEPVPGDLRDRIRRMIREQ